MSKTSKVLDINLDGFHIICIRRNSKDSNPFRVYRVSAGSRRQIAKYGDFLSVIFFIKDLYQDGSDTLPLPDLLDWAKAYGSI